MDFFNEGPPEPGVKGKKARARKNSIDEILGDDDTDAEALSKPIITAGTSTPAPVAAPAVAPVEKKKPAVKSTSRELMDFFNEGPPEPGVKGKKVKARKNSIDEILGEDVSKPDTKHLSVTSSMVLGAISALSNPATDSREPSLNSMLDVNTTGKKSAVRELIDFLREGPPGPKTTKVGKKKAKRDSADSILGNSGASSNMKFETSEKLALDISTPGTVEQRANNIVEDLYDSPVSPVSPPLSSYHHTAATRESQKLDIPSIEPNLAKNTSVLRKRNSIDEILDQDEKQTERSATQDMIKFFKQGPPEAVMNSKAQNSDKSLSKSLKKSTSQSSYLPYSTY